MGRGHMTLIAIFRNAMNFIHLGVLFHSASAVHAVFVYLRVMSLNINVVNN